MRVNISFNAGPFRIMLEEFEKPFLDDFHALYKHQLTQQNSSQRLTDFRISVKAPSGLRRYYRPQTCFYFDQFQPFYPLPYSQTLPVFEWGLNWCIATQAHQFLQFHAAGLAKNNTMVIMPAPPGSGKSTLTAALMNHGWRLFSDEIVLIRPSDGLAVPIARPINLKNNSIDIAESTFPESFLSQRFKDTHKGTVALMAPSELSVRNAHLCQKPTHIIFPKYVAGSAMQVTAMDRASAVMELVTNSFNYHMQGRPGIELAVSVVDQCECIQFTYSSFDDAYAYFDSLEV